jgi:S-formylglutathione hydrolase FrmB
MTTAKEANGHATRSLTILSVLAVSCVLAVTPCVVFAQGKLESGQISSSALEGNLLGDPATRVFWVYLPPSYETNQARYPVIYVLHGYTQTSSSLTSIKPVIDRMIQDGEIREMMAVFVDGSNRLRGSHSRSSVTIGDYETYITKDLVNLIDANYRTLPQVASRGITGFSDGGDDAMYLAMEHPDVFSVVGGQAIAGNLSAFESAALATAEVNPESLGDFRKLDLFVQWILSFAAVVAPNPD